MEIKRKTEMLVATKRRYVIRQSAPPKQTACAECGEAMLTAEQAARFFGIKQRRVFRIIEAEAAHYTETAAGATMICLKSIRWLTVSSDDKPQDEHFVIDIEHIQGGSSQRVLSPEEASQWMRKLNADDVEKSKKITGD